ncbi:MAG: zinc-binding dehydrogenase [Brevundimonas sp.]
MADFTTNISGSITYVLPGGAEGNIRTTLTERLSPINAVNLKRAHASLESGATRGKIVLEGF